MHLCPFTLILLSQKQGAAVQVAILLFFMNFRVDNCLSDAEWDRRSCQTEGRRGAGATCLSLTYFSIEMDVFHENFPFFSYLVLSIAFQRQIEIAEAARVKAEEEKVRFANSDFEIWL